MCPNIVASCARLPMGSTSAMRSHNVEAKTDEAIRCTIADAAFRFYHRSSRSMLERYAASEVLDTMVSAHRRRVGDARGGVLISCFLGGSL